jgi:uncharacterized membrane protein
MASGNDELAHRFFKEGVHVVDEVTVERPAMDLYAWWRRLSNLPSIMSHVDRVEELDERRSRWTVDGPTGQYQWEAEVINDVPGEVIAWKTVEGSEPANAGSVRFRPMDDGRGTVVRVTLEYIPPGGAIGKVTSRLMGDGRAQTLREDLAGFKKIMESGRVVDDDGRASWRPVEPPGP